MPDGNTIALPKSLSSDAINGVASMYHKLTNQAGGAAGAFSESFGLPSTLGEAKQAVRNVPSDLINLDKWKQVGHQTGQALLQPSDPALLDSAKAAWQAGDKTAAATHFMNYMLPFIGSGSDRSGEDLKHGDYGKAVGHVSAAILPFLFGNPEESAITSEAEAAKAATRQFTPKPEPKPFQGGGEEGVIRSGKGRKGLGGGKSDTPISDQLKKTYGTTDNPLEAGFILPDGEMVKLEGIHDAMAMNAAKQAGVKVSVKAGELSPRESVIQNENAVRTRVRNTPAGKEVVFSIPDQVTEEQAQNMRKAVGALGRDSNLVIEHGKEGGESHSVQFATPRHVQETLENMHAIKGEPEMTPEPHPFAEMRAQHLANDGATFSADGKTNLDGTDAWSVGVHPDRTETVATKDLTPERYQQFANKNADVLALPDRAIGSWKDETGNHVLDVTKLIKDDDEAKAAGAAADQKAIFHLKSHEQAQTGGTGGALATGEAPTMIANNASGGNKASLEDASRRAAEAGARYYDVDSRKMDSQDGWRPLPNNADMHDLKMNPKPNSHIVKIENGEMTDNWSGDKAGKLPTQEQISKWTKQPETSTPAGAEITPRPNLTKMPLASNVVSSLDAKYPARYESGFTYEGRKSNERVFTINGQDAGNFEVVERGGKLRIKSIESYTPGQGVGSKILNSILTEADKEKVPVELTASSFGSHTLSSEDLHSWYGRHGFVDEPGTDPAYGYMIREPETPITTRPNQTPYEQATQTSPEYRAGLQAKQISPRLRGDSPTLGRAAVSDASANAPTKVGANGETKLGYQDKMGLTLSKYENEGLDHEGKTAADVIDDTIKHYTGNLSALWDAIPDSIKKYSQRWYEAAHGLTSEVSRKTGVSHEKAAGVVSVLSPKNDWNNNLGNAERFIQRYQESRGHAWTDEMDDKLTELRNKKGPGGTPQPAEFKKALDFIRGKRYDEIKATDRLIARDPKKAVAAVQAGKAVWLRLVDEVEGSDSTPTYSPDGVVVGSASHNWGSMGPIVKALQILEGDGSPASIGEAIGRGHKTRNFYNNIINPWSEDGHVTVDTHAVRAAHLKAFGGDDVEVAHNFGHSKTGTPQPPSNAPVGVKGTYPIHEEAYRNVAKEKGVRPNQAQSVLWEGIRSLFGERPQEHAQALNDIWRQVGEGKLTAEQARQEIINATGGFKKPDWMPQEEWDADESRGESFNFGGQ
jgi:hypothetical protein